MNFQVFWLPEAEQMLASIWTASSDRDAVTKAANQIDQQLESAPFDFGESREANVRIGFTWPLKVLYRIHAGTAIVQVISVGSMFRS